MPREVEIDNIILPSAKNELHIYLIEEAQTSWLWSFKISEPLFKVLFFVIISIRSYLKKYVKGYAQRLHW